MRKKKDLMSRIDKIEGTLSKQNSLGKYTKVPCPSVDMPSNIAYQIVEATQSFMSKKCFQDIITKMPKQ